MEKQYFVSHNGKVHTMISECWYVVVENFKTSSKVAISYGTYLASLRLSNLLEEGEPCSETDFNTAYDKAMALRSECI